MLPTLLAAALLLLPLVVASALSADALRALSARLRERHPLHWTALRCPSSLPARAARAMLWLLRRGERALGDPVAARLARRVRWLVPAVYLLSVLWSAVFLHLLRGW